MRLQLGLSKNPVNRRTAQAQIGGQLTARPLCAAVRRSLLNTSSHSRLHGRRRCPCPTPFMLRFESLQTALRKPSLPACDRRLRRAQTLHDLLVREPVCQRQNQLCPKYVTSSQRSRIRPPGQLFTFALSHFQQLSIACHNIQPQTPSERLQNHRDRPLETLRTRASQEFGIEDPVTHCKLLC